MSRLTVGIETLKLAFPNLANAAASTWSTFRSGQGIIATLSTGLKGLGGIIAAHPIITGIAVFSGIFLGLQKLANQAEETYKKAQEQASKSKEVVDSLQQESDSIDGLIERYKELSKADRTDNSNREAIKNIQSEITKLVGNQADNLNLVNGKLDEELEKIYSIKNEIADSNIPSYEKAYLDAAKEAESFTLHDSTWVNDWFNSDTNEITLDTDDDYEVYNKANEIINKLWKKKGYGSASTQIETYDLLGLAEDYWSQLEFKEGLTLQEKIDALDEAIKAIDIDELSDSEYRQKLIEYREKLAGDDGVFTKQIDAAKTLLEKDVNSTLNNHNDSISSLDEYITFRGNIIKEVSENNIIKQALESGALSNDDIEKYVDDSLSVLEKYSDYYNEWYNKYESDSAKHIKIVKGIFSQSNNFQNSDWKASEKELTDFNNWIDGLSDSNKEYVYKISTDFTTENIKTELENLSEGGKVDLTLRPKVDNSELIKSGWDVNGEGTATVFTSTYSNKDDSIAINFTPIVTDEKGNYIKTLSPRALEEYAQGVINGTREDDLNLQIGTIFTGNEAVNQAVKAAEKIHLYQDYFYLKGDPSQFSFDEWKTALEDYKNFVQGTEEAVTSSFETLMSEKGTKDEPAFADRVDTYIDKIEKLNDAKEKLQEGKLSNSEIVKLTMTFPTLAGHTEDLGNAIDNLKEDLNSDMISDFSDQFGKMDSDEDIAKLEAFQESVLKTGEVVGDISFSIDIDVETDNMDKLYSAMKESVTSTGLTSESINNLTERYKNLKRFNATELFEKTANGIHLNTKELRELESQYEKQKKAINDVKLSNLTSQYETLTKNIQNCGDAQKAAELYAQRQDIIDQIDEVSNLAAEYEGLTSSFKKWEEAQSLGEEGDMYDSLQGGLEHIKELYDQGLIGTNEFRAAVQLMSNQDLSTANIDELISAYDKGYDKMTRYFTEGSDGCLNFLNDIQQLNSNWVKLNSDGSWDINFGIGDDEKVADELGLDVETVQSIMRKLSDYGFDINLDSIYSKLDYLQDETETASKKLQKLGLIEKPFDFDTDSISSINSQLETAQKIVDKFKDKKGNINLKTDGAIEAETILVGLLNKKQELSAPSVMQVDTSKAESDIENLIGYLQGFQKNYNDIELQTAVGADTTEAQTNIQGFISKIDTIPDDVKTKLGLDDTNFQTAVSNIKNTDISAGAKIKQEDLDTIEQTVTKINPDMLVKAGLDSSLIDNYEPDDKTAEVNYSTNQQQIDSWQPKDKTANVTYTPSVNSFTGKISSWFSGLLGGSSKATGTAFNQGNWGARKDGKSLGGELGQELVVRNGRYFTIGDNGAEFFDYKKGDIIFNAAQTRQILENGKISSGKKRGTALAEGNAFSDGVGKITVTGNSSKAKSSTSEKDKKLNAFQNWVSSIFDWIEVKLDRLSRKTDNWVTKAEQAVDYSRKSSYYKKAIKSAGNEITENSRASNTYYKQAIAIAQNGVNKGLISASTMNSALNKIKNGSINLEAYSDKQREVIEDVKTWYDKSIKSKDNILSLIKDIDSYYEALENLPIDKATEKVDKLSNSFDVLSAKLDNANSYKTQNKLLSQETSNVQKQAKIQQNAAKQTKKSYNSAVKGVQGYNFGTYQNTVNKALANGQKITVLDTWNEGAIKTVTKYNKALEANQKAQNTAALATQNATKTLRENTKAKYDNIATYYEDLRGVTSAKIGKYQTKLDFRNSMGYSSISAQQQQVYKDIIADDKSLLNNYQTERNKYNKNTLKKQYQSGKLSRTDYLSQLAYIEELDEKILQTKADIADNEYELFNIKLNKYIISLNKLEDSASSLQDKISLNETKGIATTKEQYESLIKNSKKQINNLTEQNKLIKSQMAHYSVGSEKYQELLSQYNDNNSAIMECRKSQEEWNQEILNMPINQLERQLELLDAIADRDKSNAELKKSQGKDLLEQDYFKQGLDLENKRIKQEKLANQYESYYKRALKDTNSVYDGKTANEWKELMLEAQSNVNDIKIDIIELKNELRDDVYWRVFDRAHDSAQNLQDVLEGISNLMSEDMYFDKDGKITEYGIAEVGVLVKEYENARKEVENYSKDIENLNKLYNDGFYSTNEYNEKFNELQKSLLDSASSVNTYTNKIIDMYKKIGETELNMLFELIDKRNEALNKKKEYYDYDKTIKNKTKDIISLENQIAALEGIDTAEARSKKAQLQADLSEKKEDLEDTVNDHILDISKEALDDLKKTLQESFDDRWDNLAIDLKGIADLIASAKVATETSASNISDTILAVLKFNGINAIDSSNLSRISGFASGTKSVSKSGNYWTQENNPELIVRKSDGAILTSLNNGDGVVPADLTRKLYDLAQVDLSHLIKPNIKIADIKLPQIGTDKIGNTTVNQNYDSLINIEGSADAVTVEKLKELEPEFLEKSYRYTNNKVLRSYYQSGGIRRI